MYDQAGVMGLIGGLVGALAVFWLILLAVLILEIVAKWMIYEKMGQAGWKSIIPFYNDFVLADTVHSRKMAIWYVVLEAALVILQSMSSFGTAASTMAYTDAYYGSYSSASVAGGLMGQSLILSMLSFGVSIAVLVINIIVLNRLSKGFGHDSGFTVGLVLLGCVFFPILGFSKSEQFDARRLQDNNANGGNGTVPPAQPQGQPQPQQQEQQVQ